MTDGRTTRSGERPAIGLLPFLGRREAVAILGVWAVWSAATLLFAASAMTLPVSNSSPWTAVMRAPPMARWDSGWYLNVAANGYTLNPSNRENNVGFYPFYPLAAKVVAGALHAPLLSTGIALSLICLALALLLMGDLFAELGGDGCGLAGAATLLFYPTAFFLAAFYTESMFLLFAVATIWGARRGHWEIAGLAGALGSLTRFNGFLLLLPLAVCAWQNRRAWPGSGWIRPAGAIAVTVAGAGAFPFYLWRRWGDPLLYVHSKIEGWPVRPAPPWTLLAQMAREGWGLVHHGNPAKIMFWLEAASTAFLLVATAFLLLRRLWPEAAYAAGTLLLLLTSGTHSGIARYALTIFPCFYPLALLLRRRPALSLSYAFCGVGTLVVLLHRYVHWFFVG